MKLKEVLPNIFLVEFRSLQEMGMTFLRFQEYYESPGKRFRGKVFTHAQYKKYYRKKHGRFSYCTDWTGFNVPGWIFHVFEHGTFNPLTKKEKAILKLVKGIQDPFYVIGCLKGDKESLNHEIAHGLFYTQERYRTAATEIVKSVYTDPIEKWMLGSEYCEETLIDELHAYMGVDFESLPKNLRDSVPFTDFRRARVNLCTLFEGWVCK